MFLFANKKNYSRLNDKKLLSNFRSENWNNLNANDRGRILQEVENRNAVEQERSPCTVKPVLGKEHYGCYYPTRNTIEVNIENNIKNKDGSLKQNNSYQVLDTIYHEGEHAHQMNCVKNNIVPPQGLPKTTRDMCEVENSGDNYKGVISYSNCTCEIDSNNAAIKKVLESKELFKGDHKFNDYIEERNMHFENIKNKDIRQVRMQQNEAVYRAYSCGDIDLKKHDEILLNEVYKDQPAFEEAKQMSETLQKEKLENLQTLQQENVVSEKKYSHINEGNEQDAELKDEVTHEEYDIDEQQQIKRR